MTDRFHKLGKDIALILFSRPVKLRIVVFFPIRGLNPSNIFGNPLVTLRDEVSLHLLSDVVLAKRFLHQLQRRHVGW